MIVSLVAICRRCFRGGSVLWYDKHVQSDRGDQRAQASRLSLLDSSRTQVQRSIPLLQPQVRTIYHL